MRVFVTKLKRKKLKFYQVSLVKVSTAISAFFRYVEYVTKEEHYSEIINVTRFCTNIKKKFLCPGTKEIQKTRTISEVR